MLTGQIKVCTFAETVRAIEEWRKEHKTQREAAQQVTAPDTGIAALLEIVQRINQTIDAWARDAGHSEQVLWWHE